MPCALLANVQNLEVKRSKDWHSKTLIAFGTMGNQRIVLKMYSDKKAKEKGMRAELAHYRRATQLVMQHKTPNLVVTYGSDVCARQDLPTALRKALPFQDERVGMVATQRILGPSVDDKFERMSVDETLSVIFQAAHCLAMLERSGLRHGDLHLNNMLLETHTGPLYYKIKQGGAHYFRVPARWTVKIFDWDQGTMRGAPNPNISGDCDRFDSCNLSAKGDLYTVLAILWHYTPHRAIKRLIEELIDPELLKASVPRGLYEQRKGYQYRLCRGPLTKGKRSCRPAQRTAQECSGTWRVDECLLASPANVLLHPVFSKYRTTRSASAQFWGD
jgi:hypothetical protein